MRRFEYPNIPLNRPSLETLEAMAGPVPDDIRQQILAAPLGDDLSGLRQMSYGFEFETDEWHGTPQPKKEIADYVEPMGIKVPKRYETFDEAMHVVRNGGAIMVRSEHPQEYDHFSGLSHSYLVNSDQLRNANNELISAINDGRSEEDILHLAKWESLKWTPMRRYLELNAQTAGEFYKDMSFSFWEYIPGKNIAVVADDAISGRYHLTSYGSEGRGGAVGGIFNAAGAPFNFEDQTADSMSDVVKSDKIAELIAAYEKVRALPKFSERQCAIMEMQLADDGTIWFLQYHKARPFRANEDRLDPRDYDANEGWLRAQVVRGAIGSYATLQTALYYPSFPKGAAQQYTPLNPEDASFDFHYDIGLSETVARNRVAFFSPESAHLQYRNMADGAHAPRSRWFKPFGAFSLGEDVNRALIPEDKKDILLRSVHLENMMGRFVIDVASDGLTGFVRLNPDSEQPIFGNHL